VETLTVVGTVMVWVVPFALWTVTAVTFTAVTVPRTRATLVGTPDGVARGRKVELGRPLGKAPGLPAANARAVHDPFTGEEIVTLAAVNAPAASLLPIAVMQPPAAMSA
jgi:hypothetical protein